MCVKGCRKVSGARLNGKGQKVKKRSENSGAHQRALDFALPQLGKHCEGVPLPEAKQTNSNSITLVHVWRLQRTKRRIGFLLGGHCPNLDKS